MPLSYGLALGGIISAVSAAVLVPSLMNLTLRGYGVEKGKINDKKYDYYRIFINHIFYLEIIFLS